MRIFDVGSSLSGISCYTSFDSSRITISATIFDCLSTKDLQWFNDEFGDWVGESGAMEIWISLEFDALPSILSESSVLESGKSSHLGPNTHAELFNEALSWAYPNRQIVYYVVIRGAIFQAYF